MPTQRKALVTGGNRGIGKAIAAGLSAVGIAVTIGSRDQAAGERAAQAIGAAAVQLDVAEPASIKAALNRIGPIDILVNNAGVMVQTPLLDSFDDLQSSMRTMFYGPYHLIRQAMPDMLANNHGRIVNLSSGWGSFSSGLGPGSYGVGKAALNALTYALARQVPDGKDIKINTMCPGWVRTEMGGPDANRSPEEGAETAIWLATLPPDGPTGLFFRDKQPIPW